MSLLDVPLGPNSPATFNAIIEIPRGSTNKYEVDAKTGTIKLDRVLYSPLFYPFDYGYIPQTLYLDGDPLDVLVMISHPTFPGCVVEASAIGVLEMSDDKGPDEKILAVATKDPDSATAAISRSSTTTRRRRSSTSSRSTRSLRKSPSKSWDGRGGTRAGTHRALPDRPWQPADSGLVADGRLGLADRFAHAPMGQPDLLERLSFDLVP